ncbi:MAG: outer membrane protein assembly factor BamD [Candidatus Omnitrophica bacterium]|nr:outer membrane protein assembly factor BamD [Candidatus Omnitrophota bacterium]
MKKLGIICLLIFFANLQYLYAYWIWNPKSGQWVNPKLSVKQGPQKQFEFALSLYNAEEYVDAKREFKKLIRHFPKAKEAAESQYYLGLIEEKLGNLYEAFKEYQKVIDTYPFSERIGEVIERQYAIGEAFMLGKAKRKALGLELPVDNPALEIFAKVVENSPYGALAAKAQYQLGMVYKNLGQYYEAEEAFNKVINNYPDSEWAQSAKFQIAACRALASRGPAYDQGSTKEAREKFQEFILSSPQTPLVNEAENRLKELSEKEAESNYQIGRFYEKQRDYKAAEIYYNATIEVAPESPWAVRAMERLKIMEKTKR